MAELVWIGIAFLCLVFGYLAGRTDEKKRGVATSTALNKLALLVNVRRAAGEGDLALRARVMRAQSPDPRVREQERFIGESPDAYSARLRRGGFR